MTTDDVRPVPCPTWTVTTQKITEIPLIPAGSTEHEVISVLAFTVIACGILGVIVMAFLGLIERKD